MSTIEHSDLPALIKSGQITATNYPKALAVFRNAKFWNIWAMKALLALAVGHILAGVIFFFAFNWYDLSSTHKFMIVQGGMILSVLAWIGLKLNSGPAQAFGIVATVLIGVVLAVIAQVYQTPAAIYTPFILWAYLSFPFALVSRSLAHWTVWLAILVFALSSYINGGVRAVDGNLAVIWAHIGAMAGFGLLFLIYDRWISAWFLWAKAEWFRLVLLLIFIGFAVIAFTEPFWNERDGVWIIPCVVVAGMIAYLYRFAPTVASLAFAVTGFAVLVAQVGIRLIVEIGDEVGALFLGFIWFVGITIALAKLFQHFVKKFGKPRRQATDARDPDTAEHHVTAAAFANRLSLDVDNLTQTVTALEDEKHTPWYIEGILAVTGVVTALFAGGFFGALLSMTFKIDNEYAFMGLGFIVWGGAVFVRRKSDQIFARHFFNTLVLAGGALALGAFGFIVWKSSIPSFILFGIVLSSLTLYLVCDRIIEFLCALGIAGLMGALLIHYKVVYIESVMMAVCTGLGLWFLTRPMRSRLYDAAGAAFLTAAPIFAIWSVSLGGLLLRVVGQEFADYTLDYVSKIVCVIILALGVFYLNRIKGNTNARDWEPPLPVLIPLLIAIAIMPIGSAAALLLILTGYILGLRTLAVIGTLFQIYYLYMFYYDLSINLLFKSILLAVSGGIFLLIWLWARKRYAGVLS